MIILNWDFDVLPIIFDENFMLCSLAESMNLVYKIPYRRARLAFRPSARTSKGILHTTMNYD